MHIARNDMHAGYSLEAVCGGINLVLNPGIISSLVAASMLSSSRCKALDSSADGYVRGEAAVVMSLRPAETGTDLTENYALLRGMHVNQDGRSSSLTAPSGPSQRAVILSAWADAECGITEMTATQLHGTGTALGKSPGSRVEYSLIEITFK